MKRTSLDADMNMNMNMNMHTHTQMQLDSSNGRGGGGHGNGNRGLGGGNRRDDMVHMTPSMITIDSTQSNDTSYGSLGLEMVQTDPY